MTCHAIAWLHVQKTSYIPHPMTRHLYLLGQKNMNVAHEQPIQEKRNIDDYWKVSDCDKVGAKM